MRQDRRYSFCGTQTSKRHKGVTRMKKAEYKKAVKRSVRIFAYVQVTAVRRQAVRLSKAKALALVVQVPDGDDVSATWASSEHRYLLVG